MRLKLAVTTGTFGYNALVDAIVYSAKELSVKYSTIHIQYGRSLPVSLGSLSGLDGVYTIHGLAIKAIPYYQSLADFTKDSSTVVTHGGTGTVIELLKLTLPFIVVPNTSLSGNHQEEFTRLLKNDLAVSSPQAIVKDLLSRPAPPKTLNVSGELWTHILRH
ncbi:beta-1,4-N-acetylglucosaminyltransferase [Nematocida displodere]|uniref:UDP-N-acetylglucosamine transferase subunit ALG13 n=1 Tax=Nematocida displodere TaxID=1805483 RepID=A0A177ECY7_9MICR|nr:beta-1,4-N-acetylglucosaminyltransferase [Nematocida displodere]